MPRDHQRPPSTSAPDSVRETVRAPTHAERCRTLAAQARSATLATLARDPAGFPYGSLVTVAFDDAGCPLLLLSTLAEHTSNLLEHPEASVLVTEPIERAGEALAVGRMTLLGPCRRVPAVEADSIKGTFLAAHPGASYYADFKDFGFYRLEPLSIRYVGGFGRMSWVVADEYARAQPDPLAPAAVGILKHMNDDHPDALVSYARALAHRPDATGATMTAVDQYGFELSITTPEGPRAGRVAFDSPVATSDEVRKAMVALVKTARAALSAS